MKSNTFTVVLFALFVLFSVVSAQSSSTSSASTSSASTSTAPAPAPASTASTNAIAQCLIDKGCTASDQKCRAQCAGVPDPSNSDAANTGDCVAKCNSTLPDANAYAQCKNNCITTNYYPQNSSSNTNTGSSGSSSSSPSSSGNSSSNGTSNGNSNGGSTNSSSGSNTTSTAAFVTSSNAFSAPILVLVVVAGVMGIGF